MSSRKKCYICSVKYNNDGGNLSDVSGYSEQTLLQILGEICLSDAKFISMLNSK